MNTKITKYRAIILLFIIASIFVSKQQLNAQNNEFAPIGAEWYFTRGFGIFTGESYNHFICSEEINYSFGDLQNITVKKLTKKYTYTCADEEGDYTEYFYIYQDGNKVYEVEEDNLYLLYDFSKQEGEYWVLPKYNDTAFVHKVDFIELDDGTTRKYLEITNANDYLYFNGKVIENIGYDYGLFPTPDIIPCGEWGELRCYLENNNYLISSNKDCDYEHFMNIEDFNDLNNFDFYPNPFDSYFNLYSLEEGELFIYNLTGKLVKQIKINNGVNTIQTSSLNSGMYIINFKSENKNIKGKAVKL